MIAERRDCKKAEVGYILAKFYSEYATMMKATLEKENFKGNLPKIVQELGEVNGKYAEQITKVFD